MAIQAALVICGVPSEEYPANTKTENNRASQFWAFWTLFDLKKQNPWITEGNFRG